MILLSISVILLSISAILLSIISMSHTKKLWKLQTHWDKMKLLFKQWHEEAREVYMKEYFKDDLE